MREISFRGKRTDNGEWVEGYFIQDAECYGIPSPHSYIVNHRHPSGCFGSDIYIEVDPETVGQYTEKPDKNAKKIWEHDIVSIDGEDGFFEVMWDDETARFIMTGYSITVDFDNYDSKFIERAGNIFDNPELLGKESEVEMP